MIADMSAPAVATPEPDLQPSWGDAINCLWTGASCLFMAGLFFTAWWHPDRLDEGRWVKLGVGVMVLEFILVHSGGVLHHMIGAKAGWERTKTRLMLSVVYTLFALGIALGFKSWWLLGSFAMIMSGRLWAIFAGPPTLMDEAISQRRMIASVLLYLGLMFATLLLPVPRGGVTSSVLQRVWPDRGGGAWEHRPEKALAMGMAYFLGLGLVEIRPPRKRPAARP